MFLLCEHYLKRDIVTSAFLHYAFAYIIYRSCALTLHNQIPGCASEDGFSV